MDARFNRERDFHNKTYLEQSRKIVKKYYTIRRSSNYFYEQFLQSYGENRKVLEYGCGPGSYAFHLSEKGAIVTGIDISNVAIKQAKDKAKETALKIDFRVMNAEELKFDNDTFDLICGTGILHHLELKKAFSELSRTLLPDGKAIFLEPLGHNPFINFYRKVTPNLRTKDEHPLLIRDIRLSRNYFGHVHVHYFHLCSLIAVPFRGYGYFPTILKFLDTIDESLFRFLPFFKRYAWVIAIIFSKPNKS